MKNNFDIIIIGCGLTGMISALAFSKSGYKIAILEKFDCQDKRYYADPRTTALTSSTKDFLEKINLWAQLQNSLSPINDIYVVDNKAPEMIHFNSKFVDAQNIIPMGYMIENKDFKRHLYNQCTKNENIEIIDQSTYQNISQDPDCVEISYTKDNSKSSITGKLLIICDGKNSKAKAKFFGKEFSKDYKQTAMTFLVRHQKKHEGTAVEHFLHSGPFAILPLRDQHISSIVWSMDHKRANAFLNANKAQQVALVADKFGPFLGEIEITTNIASFPLKSSHNYNYFTGKVCLVADSAHSIHPLAGQGLNLGIKDIDSLLENVKKLGFTQKALETYQSCRFKDNRNMLEITDSINSIFTNNSSYIELTRNIGFRSIQKITPLKKILINYAMGKRS